MRHPTHRDNSTIKPKPSLLGMLILVVAGVALAASGCSEQPTMVVIKGSPSIQSDGECVIEGDPETFSTHGVLDLGVTADYLLPLSVENVSAPSGEVGSQQMGGQQQQQGQGQGGVFQNLSNEGNSVLLNEAHVEIQTIGGDTLSEFDTVIGGALVEPGGGTVGVGVPVLSPGILGEIGTQAEIVVAVKLRGITTSDTEVETNTFKYPIRLCNGCLQDPTCAAEETVCLSGQDNVVCTGDPETTGG